MIIVLTILNFIAALGILAWPLAAFAALFMFDAPGSESNIITIALAFSILIYPAPAIIGNINFWKNYKTEPHSELILYTVTSTFGYILILIFVTLLNTVCSGKFAC
jgi:hypothetical protein